MWVSSCQAVRKLRHHSEVPTKEVLPLAALPIWVGQWLKPIGWWHIRDLKNFLSRKKSLVWILVVLGIPLFLAVLPYLNCANLVPKAWPPFWAMAISPRLCYLWRCSSEEHQEHCVLDNADVGGRTKRGNRTNWDVTTNWGPPLVVSDACSGCFIWRRVWNGLVTVGYRWNHQAQ